MSDTPERRDDAGPGFRGRLVASAVVVLLLAGLGGGGFWLLRGGGDDAHVTFAVRRGPLDVRVLEGGNIKALESQEIRSEVKGYPGTKILSIVEEGHYVTEEEVAEKMILVELDSSELVDKLTAAEIQFKGTEASVTEARQAYEIQMNQSESDIYSAGVEMKFARMELEKYLGKDVAAELIAGVDQYEEERESADVLSLVDSQIEAEAAQMTGEGEPKPPAVESASESSPDADMERLRISLASLQKKRPEIDFSIYADPELLGEGQANQELRKLEDATLLARMELGASLAKLQGAERLYARNFVTKLEYENNKLDYEKKQVAVASAESAQNLFVKYEFPKQAEQLLSNYIQAMRKLQRTEKLALSELAKAEAKLLSAEARYLIEQEQIHEFEDQIAKCTMRAERPGLVVYGGGQQMFWNQEEQIKEGTVVRERQAIITIPDTTKMGVDVKIHESDIKQVQKGQKVDIRVDSQSDTLLKGEVTKVAVLPDSEDRFLNPDLKVYETTISIEGSHEWLKPGMSAEVEILVKTLEDVLYIPIQAVTPQGDKQVCYVLEGGTPQPREVETGDLTVEYIVILAGLEEGEPAMLRAPEGSRQDEPTPGTPPEQPEQPEQQEPEVEGVIADAEPATVAAAPAIQ